MGYKEALAHYQIPFKQELVLVCNTNSLEEGRLRASELIKQKIEVNGLFAVEDLLALGAMKEFQNQGFKIPEEIACMGFSNWKLAELVRPSLSSVEQNGYLMGQKVVQLFIKDQQGKTEDKSFHTEIIPADLIIRESTALETKT